VFALVAALAACGKKKDGGEGAGSSEVKPVEAEKPLTCPPGNVVKDGACAEVITAEKVEAVATEKTRLDELAQLLDKAEAVAAPIELLDGIRQTDQWKKLAGANKKLAIADQVVETLNDAVKQIRTVKEGLAEAATRLGNLQGELDKFLKDTGAATQLADLRKQVSDELRGALEPVAADLAGAIEQVLVPVIAQLTDASDLIIGACAMAKLSGSGDKLKDLCAQAKDVFPKAIAFLEDAKTKPATLFADVTGKLEAALGQLIDDETRSLLATAQARVDAALKVPADAPTAPPMGHGMGGGSDGSAADPK